MDDSLSKSSIYVSILPYSHCTTERAIYKVMEGPASGGLFVYSYPVSRAVVCKLSSGNFVAIPFRPLGESGAQGPGSEAPVFFRKAKKT